MHVRVVPVPALASEEHQHVWTYSMGDTHERCVGCGEQRAVPGYVDPDVESECPAGL